MTPLIAELARVTPDPEAGYWFDLGEVPETIDFVLDPELMMHLPYDVVFVAARAGRRRVLVRAEFQLKSVLGEQISVVGFVLGDTMIRINPFVYMEKDEGIGVYPEGATKQQTTMMALSLIQTLLTRLEAQQTAYKPEVQQTFTNRRKIAEGKKPSYDWRTVTVLPRPKGEPLGGTHSSPRAHDRRGHWRTIKTKKVWVKPCKVGDPSSGTVFHDYKVPA